MCSHASSNRCWPFFLISNSSCISQSDQCCILFTDSPANRNSAASSTIKFLWGIAFIMQSRLWEISSVSTSFRATHFPKSCSSNFSVNVFKLSTQRLVISSSVCFLILSIIGFCMPNREQSSIDLYSLSQLQILSAWASSRPNLIIALRIYFSLMHIK